MSNNYINAREFLNQSDKVQKELLDWWEPQIGDRVFYNDSSNNIGKETVIIDICFDKIQTTEEDSHTKYFYPLLQIHQLIEFIEEITEGKLDMTCWRDGYEICIFNLIDNEPTKITFSGTLDLLKALWGFTIKLIEEKYND